MKWLLLWKIFTGLTRYSGPLSVALNVIFFFLSPQYLIISYSLWCLTMTSVSVRKKQLIRQCTLRPAYRSPALLLSLDWRSLSSAPSPNLTVMKVPGSCRFRFLFFVSCWTRCPGYVQCSVWGKTETCILGNALKGQRHWLFPFLPLSLPKMKLKAEEISLGNELYLFECRADSEKVKLFFLLVSW